MNLARPIRLLLLGAPGSGKGTQTFKLRQTYPQIQSLSSGDTLRAEISKGSALGKQASQFIDDGKLVPDSAMVGLITAQLSLNQWLNGSASWLLDGFPRTQPQAQKLDKVLLEKNADLTLVVELDVNQGVILDRVEARWTHLPSGRVYSMDYNPPKVPFKDDVTGEPLLKRSDDTAELFRKRLDSYNREISPLKEYYDAKGILATVSGDRSDVIFPQIKELVNAQSA